MLSAFAANLDPAHAVGRLLTPLSPHESLRTWLQVSEQQICTDLATAPLEWDKPFRTPHHSAKNVTVTTDPHAACAGSHAIAVMTEWDEFKSYDWSKIYSSMVKPAFLFDGRSEPSVATSNTISKNSKAAAAEEEGCMAVLQLALACSRAVCGHFGAVA